MEDEIEGLNASTLGRLWVAIATDANNLEFRENRRSTEKEKKCVRISTWRTSTVPLKTEANGNPFG
ncbi:zinc knuckle domain protein [Penicillium hetheringtonii]|uniref:Zinc knuckle domain protein n=1 Tax=Penicillium hetheringtonii TaxID=911720 RepID=A0AAD6DC39_9EURO|nr:zinc knuckle domain protein [Penicillium hetheringtonii]